MSNSPSLNIQTTITFNNAFYWLAQLYYYVCNKLVLPIENICTLSSRESAKSWHFETFAVLLLIQQFAVVKIIWVRARSRDTISTQDTLFKLTKQYYGTKGLYSNQQKGIITIGTNQIQFLTLNEEKSKVKETGGKIGAMIERDADFIFVFYEECSQLDGDLVENYLQSLRGNIHTQRICTYISNPWRRDQWYVDKTIKYLPEDKDAEEQLIRDGYNSRFDSLTKTLYFRPRYTINPHVNESNVKKIEELKEYNYSKWRIVSLGFSGNLNGTLYGPSLPKLKDAIAPYYGQQFFGGVDWGDGCSKQGSPSVCYFGGISLGRGIDIYAEMEWWNNKGKVLSTQEQVQMICKFYIDQYTKIKRPITVFVDNAALGDFFSMFQLELGRQGFSSQEIEFLPAWKPKNIWERVESVNAYISLGILRYNKEVCKGLYKAMENCYEVVKTNPTEGGKRERSHEWTHWLNALEYLLNTYLKEFQSQLPEYLIDDKSLNEYGTY